MTDKTGKTDRKPGPQAIDDAALEDVSGGPVYIKVDSVTAAPPDPVRIRSITDGTSNT